jgi:hypothetical protein
VNRRRNSLNGIDSRLGETIEDRFLGVDRVVIDVTRIEWKLAFDMQDDLE